MPSSSTNLQSFPHFSALPIEIRLRIWQLASPRRPRVIQVGYDPEKSCWKAWRDGLGGLPSIVHVSKEAREEALKPYSRMFDAYIDPEEDTIFLSDVCLLSYTSAPDFSKSLRLLMKHSSLGKRLTSHSSSRCFRYENLGAYS